MALQQHVLDSIDGSWIADEAERLVRVPSVTLEEEEVCRLYEQQLGELGLDVDVREVTPGRPNLYAGIRGTGGGSTLMLNGHLDTIPNQNNQPVYRDGDLLYGRGTTDMKGGMAAVLGAARALLAANVQFRGDLLLTAVVGHEEPEAQKDGPRALIEDINSGREPFETPADDPVTKAVAAAHREVTGTEGELVGKRIVGDANLYVHGSGVATIYYGPSNETAHADVENVSIQRMESAAKVYALAAMEFCGVDGER